MGPALSGTVMKSQSAMPIAIVVLLIAIVISLPAAGMSTASNVIQAFGHFAVGWSYAAGIIIFLVLLVIQFVVINPGAARPSEVAARFTPAPVPGRHLAADADLAAEIIDPEEAREKRAEIGKEAEFGGAVDGAIRITPRNAIPSILITLISIIQDLTNLVTRYLQ
jgi:flagellar biosynthesis protein FlhA